MESNSNKRKKVSPLKVVLPKDSKTKTSAKRHRKLNMSPEKRQLDDLVRSPLKREEEVEMATDSGENFIISLRAFVIEIHDFKTRFRKLSELTEETTDAKTAERYS